MRLRTPTANPGTAAATVLALKRGKPVVLGTLSGAPQGDQATQMAMPRSVNRVIIAVDVPFSGFAVLEITQDTTSFQELVQQPDHGEFVLDVAP